MLLDELRAVGLDLEQPLHAAYPAEVRQAGVRLVREHLFAGHSDDAAYFLIGRAAVDGFLETFVGQSFAFVVRFLGPRAMLKRVGTVMLSASNYVTAVAVERGPFRWEVTVQHGDLPPAYFLGMARAALDVYDLNPHIEVVRSGDEGLVLGVGWSPSDAVSTR